jgi:hypothetical protein
VSQKVPVEAQMPEVAQKRLEASPKVSLGLRRFATQEIPQDLPYRASRGDLRYRWRKDLPEDLPLGYSLQGYYPPEDLTHYLPEDYYLPQNRPEDR